jgi:hypothetical protein
VEEAPLTLKQQRKRNAAAAAAASNLEKESLRTQHFVAAVPAEEEQPAGAEVGEQPVVP